MKSQPLKANRAATGLVTAAIGLFIGCAPPEVNVSWDGSAPCQSLALRVFVLIEDVPVSVGAHTVVSPKGRGFNAIYVPSEEIEGKSEIEVVIDRSGNRQTVQKRVPPRTCIGDKAIEDADVVAVRPLKIAIENLEMTLEYRVSGVTTARPQTGIASVVDRRLQWKMPRGVLEQHRFGTSPPSNITLPQLTLTGATGVRTIQPLLGAHEVLQLVGPSLTRDANKKPYTRGAPILVIDGANVSIFRGGSQGVALSDLGAVARVDSTSDKVGECAYTDAAGRRSSRQTYRVDVAMSLRELRSDRILASTRMTGGQPECADVMYKSVGDTARLSFEDLQKLIMSPDRLVFSGSRPSVEAWLSRY